MKRYVTVHVSNRDESFSVELPPKAAFRLAGEYRRAGYEVYCE